MKSLHEDPRFQELVSTCTPPLVVVVHSTGAIIDEEHTSRIPYARAGVPREARRMNLMRHAAGAPAATSASVSNRTGGTRRQGSPGITPALRHNPSSSRRGVVRTCSATAHVSRRESLALLTTLITTSAPSPTTGGRAANAAVEDDASGSFYEVGRGASSTLA